MSTAPLAALPGPAPVPLLGWRANALRFLLDPIGYMDRLNLTRGLAAFVAGGCPQVLLQGQGYGSVFALGAEANQAVLGDMAAYHSRRVPGPPESPDFAQLTSGLFSMNTDRHQQQRRLIAPALQRQRVAGYLDTMVGLTDRWLAGWTVGETRDVLADLTRLTVGIMNRCLFGLDADAATSDLGARIQAVIGASVSPLSLLPAALPGTPRRRLVADAASVARDLRALVAQKRADPSARDVVASLVRARDDDGQTLTDDELLGQIFLLFFAGHDTTRNALAWTLLLLAQHPTVAHDLRDELTGTLGGGPPSLDQLGALPLLDAVIKESLRLFPPAPFTLRETTREVDLCGATLPAGVEVILSYYHTHRDPAVYPEPGRFLPDRWSGEAPPPYAYVPFGGGARVCVGAAFASQELRIALAELLRGARWELAEPKPVPNALRIGTFGPKTGIRLRRAAVTTDFGLTPP